MKDQDMENEKTTFESTIARLEEIVRSLESGSAPLDESLALYEEGVKLVRFCNEKLEYAEQRVKLLVEGADGSLTEADLPDRG